MSTENQHHQPSLASEIAEMQRSEDEARAEGTMTKIPGIKSLHAIISHQCVENRGRLGVLSETRKRVEESLFDLLKTLSLKSGIKIHVSITVEHPNEPK